MIPVKEKRTALTVSSISLVIFAISCLCLISYFNSFSNEFVWDDIVLIRNNHEIESFSNIGRLFTEDLGRTLNASTGYYRPLQMLSYAIEYAIWGRNPFFYHITSLIIHILNALLVFYLCFLVTKEAWKSFVVSAIFSTHPAFVAVVAYISGRADLLGLFFALITIVLFIRSVASGRLTLLSWMGVVSYILAVLSKEYYIITPLFCLLYILIIKKGAGRLWKPILLALLSAAVIYMALRATIMNFHQDMGGIAEEAFLTRAAVFPYLFTKYISALILPVDLGMEKRLVYESLAEPRFIFSYLPALFAAWLCYHFYKKGKETGLFFLGWFLIAIIPVSNLFIPLKALWADHWTYMASIGFFGLLVWAAAGPARRFPAQNGLRLAGMGAAVLMIGVSSFLTIAENRHWENEEVFYLRILTKNPDNPKANFNMGEFYRERGDYGRALEFYDKAVSSSLGKDAMFLTSRGMLQRKLGNMAKARDDFEAAVKTAPSIAVYHNNLGAIYAELGITDKARAELEEVLRLRPGDERAARNLKKLNESLP